MWLYASEWGAGVFDLERAADAETRAAGEQNPCLAAFLLLVRSRSAGQFHLSVTALRSSFWRLPRSQAYCHRHDDHWKLLKTKNATSRNDELNQLGT